MISSVRSSRRSTDTWPSTPVWSFSSMTSGPPRPAAVGPLLRVLARLFVPGAVAVSLCLRLGFVACVVGLVVGGAYPGIWLRARLGPRQRAGVWALPCAVELLPLSDEPGLDLTAAL